LRALALHPDVLVATSAIWQTNCVIVRATMGEGVPDARGEGVPDARGEGVPDASQESFLIDSPVLPAELEALPTLLEQSGFAAPSGLLVTHGDWDHLLGTLAFPGVALGCAESTAARLHASPGEAQRGLRAFDEGLHIERPRPLGLGAVQALPVPGRCGIGAFELELHPATGHTADGMAIWSPWAKVLAVGDYLSTVEIPSLSETGGSLTAYLATLECLRPLVGGAEHIVPGHGPVLSPRRALDVLDEDLAYLLALREGSSDVALPDGRRTRAQRAAHRENLTRLAG
jgi:glyoxylase-like metal-dependent hydrolase (beta-lactamase superfamily II)